MDFTELSPDDLRRRAELARKLRLLMDVILAEDGKPVTYTVLAAYLKRRGLSLSRARWTYMLAGNRYLVDDHELLTGIADFFEVDPAYLIGSDGGDVPAKVEAALQFVRAERLGAVRMYATRKLGDFSPETLEKLTSILDEAERRSKDSPDGPS